MTYNPTYFSMSEFECNCGQCETRMDEAFVKKLDTLRGNCGFPIILNSGYRCPSYNHRVSKTGKNGPHTTGKAVDIAIYGHQAHKLLTEALKLDFQGVGVSQKGKREFRFIHIDDLDDDNYSGPRPWVWTY